MAFTDAQIRAVMQQYLNSSYDELRSHAIHYANSFVEELSKLGAPPSQAMFSLIEIARIAVRADGVLSAREQQFINDMFKDSFSDLVLSNFDSTKTRNNVEKETVDLFGRLSSEGKLCALNFVSTIIAVDGDLDRAEIAYLSKLLNA